MEYKSFEKAFGSWGRLFKEFIESPSMDKIYEVLKRRSSRGISTFPAAGDTFKAFEKCDYSNLKAVLVGLCPYHTKKNGVIIADGLMMSCSKTRVLQPSLENLYKGIEEDIFGGLNLNIIKNPDLSYLAYQGVLLYNIALTTEENKPGSDVGLWSEFNTFFFTQVLNTYLRGVPIVLMGKEAAKCEALITPFLHYTKVVEHPAAASYSGKDWAHGEMFSWINNILKANNGTPIDWVDHNLEF